MVIDGEQSCWFEPLTRRWVPTTGDHACWVSRITYLHSVQVLIGTGQAFVNHAYWSFSRGPSGPRPLSFANQIHAQYPVLVRLRLLTTSPQHANSGTFACLACMVFHKA